MTIEELATWLWNPYVGTFAVVIALGYVVRAVPKISNAYIPIIGMVAGALFFATVASLTLIRNPEHPAAWTVMCFGVGWVISAFAWLVHHVLISRLEDKLGEWFPPLGNWLKKTSDSKTTTPPAP